MDINKDRFVQLVTEEVMRCLQSNRINNTKDKKPVLVFGDIGKIPLIYSDKYEYLNNDSYICDHDIQKYCFVFITEISNAQLCDIASGRDDTPFTSAIQKALLAGKKIYILKSALSYKKYRETAPPKLYDMLEQHVRTIIEFGVTIAEDTETADNNICKESKDELYSCNEKLITYEAARKLCQKIRNQVIFPKGTIITPLAKDLFLKEKIEIKMIQGQEDRL